MFEQATELALTQRRMARRKVEYLSDPVAWCRERAGVTLWSKQAEIAMSVTDNHDVIVKAGHSVGKSKLAALLICWWIDTRYPDGRVASTAPSVSQVGAIVWYEVRQTFATVQKRYEEGLTYAPLPGYITAENRWKTNEGLEVGAGRKPPERDMENAFQGIHAPKGVLVVGDEACGLSKETIDALGNITTTAESRRFLILNPTNPASYAGEIFREDLPNWTKHTISVFDSPNFTGEVVPPEVARALVDQSFVDIKKAEYGEGSPRYMSRVLGEFAFDLDASLIVLEDIAVAHDLDIPVSGNRPILGVDVARFGKDLSVIYSNDNGRVRFHSSWGMTDGVSTAEKIHKAVLETGAIEVRIDGSGIGGPIADVLNRLRTDSGSDYEIIEMMGGWAAPDNQEHSNARSYWFDKFRYDLRAGKFDLDFADTKATEELLAIQYAFRAGSNALKMESKDDMRRRGAKSPDYADAIIYCVADMEYLRNPTPTGRILMETEVFSSESRNDPVLDCLNW